jgi:acyl carrier protein
MQAFDESPGSFLICVHLCASVVPSLLRVSVLKRHFQDAECNRKLHTIHQSLYSRTTGGFAISVDFQVDLMTDSELIEAVNSVFMESFEIPAEKIKPEAQIFVDLGLDSLDVVDLVAAIQKKFSVQVRDDERVRSIRTLGDLYNYLILIRAEQNKG